MDPRNFLYDGRLFQFETLSYDEKSNNLEAIEKILYGTEFANKIVEYKLATGESIKTDKKYSDLILSASKTSKVSAYHLASRIKQEVGPFLSHLSISGTVSGYEGLYNFYNIGATSDPNGLQVIKNGLQYAKDGKGASAEVRTRYIIPWNTKERSITGGAIFIGSSYINVGQNTIYLQKFDVNDESAGTLFWHQYMTNVLAPYSESKIIYTGYSNSGLLNYPLTFTIPIYNNMPNMPKDSPAILLSDYIDDDTKVRANTSGVLNIRTGPGTSYEVLTSVTKNDVMTRIKKGKQKGELWDKVILENGMIGYAFQNYLEEVPEEPEKPEEEEVEEPPEEITEPEEPIENYEGPEITFDTTLRISGNEISGLDYANITAGGIRDKIYTTFTLEIYNREGTLITDDKNLGTGYKLVFKDNNNVKAEYNLILYGDANGDARINSVDLLTIQRHILKLSSLKGVYLKASNTFKNGRNPSSIDLLRIQRHILNLERLVQ